jgi:hypothetical protein
MKKFWVLRYSSRWSTHLKVKVTLRLTVSQSVCLGVEPNLGLVTRYYFLSENCLVSMGHPLWREDGSAVCSAITKWSGSRRARNHTLLSHLRLSQPGGPDSLIYIPQEQGGPVIPPGTGFPLRSLLWLTGGGIPTRLHTDSMHLWSTYYRTVLYVDLCLISFTVCNDRRHWSLNTDCLVFK